MSTYRVDFSIEFEAESEREAREAAKEWLDDWTAEEIVASLKEATVSVEKVDVAARRRAVMDAEIAKDYRPGVYNGD
jgi:hypothetical protein